MATARKKQSKSLIENATSMALKFATKANDCALKTTEKAFSKSFEMSEKCSGTTHTIVKKGLTISAMQQDLVFDILSGIKKRIIKK